MGSIWAAYVRRGHGPSTAFGTARWANAHDLRGAGMLGARTGLILGRVIDGGKRPFSKAVLGLFDLRVKSKDACEDFLAAFQKVGKPKAARALVRMPNAVHTAFFAPTGVGKGVSRVLPFLLSCPDAAVVVDFKGKIPG